MEYLITAAAGDHHRRQTPVKAVVPYDGAPGSLVLETMDGERVPVQGQLADGGLELTWILADLPPGEEASYRLTVGPDAESTPWTSGVELVEENGQLLITVGDEHFTSYQFDTRPQTGAGPRPYFYPVHDAHGRAVTRHFPMREGVPDERTDHPHHRSLYVAHGAVNGVDHWSEAEGHGHMRHQDFVSLVSGPVWGGFVQDLIWCRPDGGAQLAERRAVTVYNVSGNLRMLDVTSIYEAAYGSVLLGDTKEGGLISVRVAGTMKGSSGGRIENATGAVGEGETWGRRAPWCDYSGTVGRGDNEGIVGIALFDHPENLRHPTYWHVRNYGLMTANPFGISHFKGLDRDGQRPGDVSLASGEVLVQRYRVLIHPGRAAEAQVAEHYHGFANPPQAGVEAV